MNPTEEYDKIVEVGKCASTGLSVQICYNAFGNPSNPCILLIQGLGAQLLGYHMVFIEHLVSAGFYVIRYDNRDVGRSTHFDAFAAPSMLRYALPGYLSLFESIPYTLKDMMEDGMGLLTALDIRHAHVFGISMGGMIAQLMAIHYPDRILSLSIHCSNLGGADTIHPSLTAYLPFLLHPTIQTDEAAYVRNMMRAIQFLTCDAYANETEILEKFLHDNWRRCPSTTGTGRQIAAVMRCDSRRKGLSELTIPVLVFHGLRDQLIPFRNALEIGKCVKRSKVVLFPHIAHDFPPSLAKEFADEIILLASSVQK